MCWDFHEMRVCLTRYTIRAWNLRSWLIEGSLDGESRTEVVRQTDTPDFMICRCGMWKISSFDVSNAVECRFIRVTRADKTHDCEEARLVLYAVESFGNLSEQTRIVDCVNVNRKNLPQRVPGVISWPHISMRVERSWRICRVLALGAEICHSNSAISF
jgi:hypothetical protein